VSPHRSSRRPCSRERGTIALMVGASLVALFGSVAIAVDLGNARATEGRTVTAADAAALAAADQLTSGANEIDACAAAGTIVAANEPAATMISCETEFASSGANIVTVKVSQPVDYVFAPVFGFTSSTVSSRTSALYGIQGVQGARPFGLCMESLQTLLAGWDPLGPTSIGPIVVSYGKGSQPEACNDGDPLPGNWGSLDFDGGANSNNDQQEWIENGFPSMVYPPATIEGSPGAMGGTFASALQVLVTSGEVFPVPLFDQASDNGANADFGIIGFVNAQLTDFDVNGSADSRYLELVFHPSELPGVACCDPTGPSVVIRLPAICAVNDQTAAC
jgi:Flp pilus assembly protein TadG